MDFLSKCKVLGELWLFYREDAATNEAWSQFFSYSDVALPAAYIINEGYVNEEVEPELEAFIDESWEIFCEYIDIDPNGNYEGIAEAWNASSNPPLNEEVKEEVKVKRTRKKDILPPE